MFFLVSASFAFVGFSLLFFVVAMTTENREGFNGESENGVGRVGFYCIVGLIFLGFQAHYTFTLLGKKKKPI